MKQAQFEDEEVEQLTNYNVGDTIPVPPRFLEISDGESLPNYLDIGYGKSSYANGIETEKPNGTKVFIVSVEGEWYKLTYHRHTHPDEKGVTIRARGDFDVERIFGEDDLDSRTTREYQDETVEQIKQIICENVDERCEHLGSEILAGLSGFEATGTTIDLVYADYTMRNEIKKEVDETVDENVNWDIIHDLCSSTPVRIKIE